MTVGERDREVAYLVLGQSDNRHDHAHLIAEAIAAERAATEARVLAPIRALADWCDREARDIDLNANPAVVLWDVETRLRAVLPPESIHTTREG